MARVPPPSDWLMQIAGTAQEVELPWLSALGRRDQSSSPQNGSVIVWQVDRLNEVAQDLAA